MPTIIENLDKAIEIMESLPTGLINLANFGSPECGTLACTAGHLARDEFFKQQGFSWIVKAFPCLNKRPLFTVQGGQDLNEMFGQYAYKRLSTIRGESPFDSKDPSLTDKQLSIARLKAQKERHELNLLKPEELVCPPSKKT